VPKVNVSLDKRLERRLHRYYWSYRHCRHCTTAANAATAAIATAVTAANVAIGTNAATTATAATSTTDITATTDATATAAPYLLQKKIEEGGDAGPDNEGIAEQCDASTQGLAQSSAVKPYRAKHHRPLDPGGLIRMGLFQGAVIAEHVDLAIKHMSDEAGVAIALIGNTGQEIDEDREQNESEAGEEKGFRV